MDPSKAIIYAQLVNATYAIQPTDLVNRAGTAIDVGGTAYMIVTSIYANDLATEMNLPRGTSIVSMGLILQSPAGEVVIAIRGTEGIWEWVQDGRFLQVPCPFLAGAGNTEDGFTAMYQSMQTGTAAGSPTVVNALKTMVFPVAVSAVTICGHSLGGALATLSALDIAANTKYTDPTVYTFASPKTGNATFVAAYNHVVPDMYRVANRLDIVPNLPPAPLYSDVLGAYELNPVQLLPPKILVNPSLACEHTLDSYLYLLSLQTNGPVLPLDAGCTPP
jgi:hypothetical protein